MVPMKTRPWAITGVEWDSVPEAPRGTLHRMWVPLVGLNVAGRLTSGEVMFRDQASPNCGRSAAWRDIRAARLANAWARVNMGVNLGQGARRRNTYPLVAGSVPPIYTKGATLAYFL